jgi:hypothetical protein
MSINSLSCIQSIIANKTIVPSGPPPIIQTMSNVYTQNPFLYWAGDSGQITKNSNGIVMGFRTTISNQISPYTFKNGYYYVTTSDTISGTNSLGGDLYTTFCGNINNVPDTPWQSPTVYTTSGAYTGTTQTVTSGTTVYGEWVQIRLPYKLYITNYQVNSNAPNNGSYWNNLFTTSFYVCASNDGTTLDND